MKIQMTARFQILRRMPDGTWTPQSNDEFIDRYNSGEEVRE